MPTYPEPLPMILRQQRLALITNGKCGGTSVKRWLFDLLDLPTSPLRLPALVARTSPAFARAFFLRGGRRMHAGLDASLNVRRLSRLYNQTVSRGLMEQARDPSFLKLWVVRNPVDRCISGYLDKFCGRTLAKEWMREVVAQGGSGGTLSFAQFVAYLEAADNDRVNGHWRRQTYNAGWFAPDQLIPIRIEHLAEDMGRVQHPAVQAKLPLLGALNVNRRARGATAPDVDAPWDMPNTALNAYLEAHGRLPPARAFLSDDLTARIRRIYAADFAAMPYSPSGAA
jgi:hypothetical protein